MPNPKKHHALVFVRFAHDRRFVGAVLSLFVLFVLFVFIRISGRHCVAHAHEGTPIDQPGGKFLGDMWGHVVAPRVWTLWDFDIVSVASYVRKVPTSGTEADAITSKALNDFVQSVLDEVSDRRHRAFSFGHCRQLAKRSN
jgi:hypothetical protein